MDELFDWLPTIGMAAAITAAIWGMSSCYKAGVREMEAEPPQVVVDKSHTTEAYSCGQNCVTNSDSWTLLSQSGDMCKVSRREYATIRIGQEWKCAQLFGWYQ